MVDANGLSHAPKDLKVPQLVGRGPFSALEVKEWLFFPPYSHKAAHDLWMYFQVFPMDFFLELLAMF